MENGPRISFFGYLELFRCHQIRRSFEAIACTNMHNNDNNTVDNKRWSFILKKNVKATFIRLLLELDVMKNESNYTNVHRQTIVNTIKIKDYLILAQNRVCDIMDKLISVLKDNNRVQWNFSLCLSENDLNVPFFLRTMSCLKLRDII